METADGKRVTSLIDRVMDRLLFPLAELFWPELKQTTGQRRVVGAGEVLSFLYAAPLALAGLVWLVSVTDVQVFRREWELMLLMAGLMFLFRKLGYFIIQEIRTGRYASSDNSMDSMILWSGIFLLGPTALWIAVVLSFVDFAWRQREKVPAVDRWNRLRNFAFYLAFTNLAVLVTLEIYEALGGTIPIPTLTPAAIIPALVALVAYFWLVLAVWSGFILYSIWAQATLSHGESPVPLIRFLLTALGLPSLAHPFAILAAGLYVEFGIATFSFFVIGLVLVAVLARRLSWAAEYSRQHSRQLEKLELLSLDILRAPPDASTLPELLQEHVPTMFPSGRVAVWVYGDQVLLQKPDDWLPEIGLIWPWLVNQTQPQAFLAKDSLPWHELNSPHHAVVITPIMNVQGEQVIGGVYLELFSLVSPWDMHSLQNLFPAVLSLAGQVSSALHGATVYEKAVAYQKVSHELSLAGKIQASFLPDEMPNLSGWQLAVTFLPARETSGDFFDLIPLEDGKQGLLIADVTDKGVGAALYMALSRTLIRTYAIEFYDDPQPDVVFFAANGRLLRDARADLFVTAFYGILDPEKGTLTYSNAGHNPPYLVSNRNGHIEVIALKATGMPIGVDEETVWGQETVEIRPGDALLLYTDGIPDANNAEGAFFGDERLQQVAGAALGLQADEIQGVLIDEVQEFVGEAAQYDDITLLILVRDPVPEPQVTDLEQAH